MASAKKRTVLTRLELEVMNTLWSGDTSFTVREVLERLNRGRKEKLAYTTVQTVLTILKNKRVVSSQPGPGRAHTFRVAVSRENVTTSMVRDLVKRLFGGRVQPLVQRLLEDESLSTGEIEEIKEWIDNRLEDGRERRK
jgi:predicted transcriptional regulator